MSRECSPRPRRPQPATVAVVAPALAWLAAIAVAGDRPSPPALRPEALKQGMSVLAIGDSNTESGNWVQPLADELQAAAGYFGSGYRGFGGGKPDHIVGNARHPELQPWLRLSAEGPWECQYGEGLFSQYAPDNAARVGTMPGARLVAEFWGASVRVFHLSGKDLGRFRLLLDGTEARVVDCADASVSDERKYDFRAVELANLTPGWHKLEVEVVNAPVVPLGLDVRATPVAAGPAALVHKWGRSSSWTDHHVGIKRHIHEQAIKLLLPDVVLTMLGTNDHNIQGNGAAVVMRNTAELVGRTRAASPTTRVLILSTLEFGPTPQSAWALRGYLEDWPRLAEGLGVASWDLHAWMLPKWRDYVYQGEEIHFSPAGGKRVAAELVRQIRQLKPQTLPPAGRPAGEPAAPASLPVTGQVMAWFSADGPVELDPEGRVAAWRSCVPGFGAASASQPIPAYRPVLAPRAIGGKPAMRFEGGQYLVMDTSWSTRGWAAVWSARRPQGSLIADGRTFYAHWGPGEPGSQKLLHPKLARPGRWFLDGREVKAEDLTYPLAGPHILIWSSDAFANLDLIGHHRHLKGDAGVPEGQVSFLDADVAELLVRVNLNFTDAERTMLEDYWAKKYGITLKR